MPKATATSEDELDGKSRVTDLAARKKKNADAQAAFRQRRAVYIESLEETVIRLEKVVEDLQHGSHEKTDDIEALKQEVHLLKHEGRERERIWKSVWKGHHPGMSAPIPESTLFGNLVSSSAEPVSPVSRPTPQYEERYVDAQASSAGHYPAPYPHAPHYVDVSPTLSHPSVSVAIPQHASASSAVHYNPYAPYDMGPHAIPSSSATSAGPGGTPPLHSPSAYSDHRNLAYATPRYIVDERGNALPSVGVSTYVLEHSPVSSAPSTPISTSSASISSVAAGYQYPAVSPSHETADGAYARHNPHAHGHGMSLTLHGGTADISSLLASSSRGFAYGKGVRPTTLFNAPAVSPPSASIGLESPPMQDRSRPSSGAACTTSSPHSPPDSSSPPDSPAVKREPLISDTLTILKMQAFGTARRTNRTCSKKSAAAAQLAIDAIEARAVGRSVRKSKRARARDHDRIPA